MKLIGSANNRLRDYNILFLQRIIFSGVENEFGLFGRRGWLDKNLAAFREGNGCGEYLTQQVREGNTQQF
jgi:hypothetical protein